MKISAFKMLLDGVTDLNSCQFRLLQKQIKAVVWSKHVSAEFETPVSQIVCPHCGSTKFHRWGNVMIYNDIDANYA